MAFGPSLSSPLLITFLFGDYLKSTFYRNSQDFFAMMGAHLLALASNLHGREAFVWGLVSVPSICSQPCSLYFPNSLFSSIYILSSFKCVLSLQRASLASNGSNFVPRKILFLTSFTLLFFRSFWIKHRNFLTFIFNIHLFNILL